MKLFHLLFIGLLLSLTAQSQDQHCYSTEAYTKLIKGHPEVLQAHAQLEQFTRQYIAAQAQQRTTGTIYIIPLVFHIIHNYGSENISDDQVTDAVRILNLDYRKLNNDTANVVPAFKSIAADCGFEFRLANIDPNGKCTNGIDRIASPLTYSGDDNSKLNPWPNSKYLNIWVVNSLADAQAAAYAYYPGAPDEIDGVIVRSTYVGSIGTGNVVTSRTLTHEIGHCFNLKHPWGDTNSPGVDCSGDDGVSDTPKTIGWATCNLSGSSCGSPLDNVQNYMEYSYCTNMFTLGQKARMIAALNSSTSSRNNLWTSANATATGINLSVPSTCAPMADFEVNYPVICFQQSVQFTDLSWNGEPTSWSWNFPGGSPSSSSISSPLISYNTPGTYNVTLTVSNSKGLTSITKNSTVTVTGNATTGVPYSQDFETPSSFPGPDAYVINPDNGNTWIKATNVGSSGTSSIMIKNYLGTPLGQSDTYVSPSFNFTYLSLALLTFQVANAQRNSGSRDSLRVWVSDNCGQTWSPRYTKTGAALATAGIVSTNFVPTSSQWRKETVNLYLYGGKPNVRIRFENINGGGNNTYIDEINITGVVGVNEAEAAGLTFDVYPNPSHNEATVRFELMKKSNAQILLMDMTGREVRFIHDGALNSGPQQFNIESGNLSKGIYLVELVIDGNRVVKKLIVD